MEQTEQLLSNALSVEDLRNLARRRLPKMVFDYVDGGADDEVSRNRNRREFDKVAFRHRVFVDVSKVDMSIELFGYRFAAPFGISPTGLSGLVWPKAELLLTRAAAEQNIPFSLSTVSSVRLEEIAKENDHPKWFQLYIFKDRELSRELARRAWNAGFRVLVITADCATGGNRERDHRNNFTLPLKPSAKTVIDFMTKPHWLAQMVLNGAPRPENMVEAAQKVEKSKSAQSLVAFMSSQLDPSVTWKDVKPFVDEWRGPVVIKGVLSRDDVFKARDVGASGVVVSNHGGRQLDGTIPPLVILPEMVEAAGHEVDVFCDSGFRRGSDIVKAIALGAKAVLMGRNTLYGAGAAGARGINHTINILKSEVVRTMTLLGCRSLSEIDGSRVSKLPFRESGD